MLEIFKQLFQSSIIDNAVSDVTGITLAISWSLAVIFIAMHIPIIGIQSVVQIKKPIEILQLKAGNIVLITLIYAYASFMSPIDALINTIAEESSPSMERADAYYEHLHAVYFVNENGTNPSQEQLAELDEDELQAVQSEIEVVKKTGEIPAEVGNEDTDWFDLLLDAPGSLGAFLISGMIGFIITIIKGAMVGVSLVLMKLLYIVGSLALAFSILPPFREKAMVWFGTYLTIALNLVTLNLIDILFYDVMIGQVVAVQHLQTFDKLATTVFNLVMIVSYIMSFWLTSKWVGSESAGRFMTAAMGMAAGVAKSAMGSAFGGGGGGGGNSTNSPVQNVTETIKDGLKKA